MRSKTTRAVLNNPFPYWELTHVIAEKEKMSSNYKGNKLNTFSDEKNKIKQAEIYLRGPTQTREGQVLSSRFGFGGLCSREDTIIITQTWQQRRRRKKEGGDVEMETRGGGDELGRSGSLHRRGLCMQYCMCMPMMVTGSVKALIGPPPGEIFSLHSPQTASLCAPVVTLEYQPKYSSGLPLISVL
jgi:hypothetical protein